MSNQLGHENRNEKLLPAAAEGNVKLDKWNKYNNSAMPTAQCAQMDGNEHEPQPELVAGLWKSVNQLSDVIEIKWNCVWKIKIMFTPIKISLTRIVFLHRGTSVSHVVVVDVVVVVIKHSLESDVEWNLK